ncbi:MAG TPA: hypothetical protein VKH37_01655 [Ferruginibacter sp.]|nr:hypothetical protein [Ferruginibacter sp.]
MKYSAFLLLACCILFASCNNYGTKYTSDKEHEVYYKGDGVTEDHAKKLNQYLLDLPYFQPGHKASVQLTKNKDTFNVNFVYDKDKVNDAIVGTFKQVGGDMSTKVFNGSPVTIKLVNETMETFRDIGYTPAEHE